MLLSLPLDMFVTASALVSSGHFVDDGSDPAAVGDEGKKSISRNN